MVPRHVLLCHASLLLCPLSPQPRMSLPTLLCIPGEVLFLLQVYLVVTFLHESFPDSTRLNDEVLSLGLPSALHTPWLALTSLYGSYSFMCLSPLLDCELPESKECLVLLCIPSA